MSAKRTFFQIRILGAVLVVGFVLTGALTGLRQQIPGLDSEDIDCDFRTEILRERLLNTMERPVGARTEAAFANLLRETTAACADQDPELKHKLETIQGIAEENDAWRRRSAEARATLRSL